jgi:hypothetical protein
MRIVSLLPALCLALLAMTGACGKRHRADDGDAGAVDDDSPETRRSLAMSQTHNCALREAGLYCWGENFQGQLGTGAVDEQEEPLPPVRAAVAGDDIVDVVAVTARTCVRRESGQIACWGANDRGQFGDGTRDDSVSARTTLDIDDAVQLALDDESSCALRADGRVFCWGGSPKWAPEQGWLTPTAVAGVDDALQIAGGILGTYCARGKAGWVRCFRLENGSFSKVQEMSALQGARGLIVTASNMACALLPSSEIVCENMENGAVSTLGDSKGSRSLVGTELVACAQGASNSWRCWNVLAPMLESVGSQPIELPTQTPLVELIPAGLRICGLQQDRAVVCVDAASFFPALTVVAGLPD